MPSADYDLINNILIVGDITSAFSNFQIIQEDRTTICQSTLGAIETASKQDFDLIAIIIPENTSKLGNALKTMRHAAGSVKIVLLAQMWQEPIAKKFAEQEHSGTEYADDYLICPIEWEQFLQTFQPENTEGSSAKKIAELEKLATTDELTGLKNRRYIWEFARQIIEHSKKDQGRVTLLLFDIDNFKHYNDEYSHSAGDEILQQAGKLMTNCCRNHDVVGRIGGDEFAVIFWDEPSYDTTQTPSERRQTLSEHPTEPIFIANRFRNAINSARLTRLGPEGKGVLTISGGLATFPRDGSNIDELFEKADQAMLEAKRSGKNSIYLVGTQKNDVANI